MRLGIALAFFVLEERGIAEVGAASSAARKEGEKLNGAVGGRVSSGDGGVVEGLLTFRHWVCVGHLDFHGVDGQSVRVEGCGMGLGGW